MIVLIDNYDSFSYNLYQALAEYTNEIKVLRNDEMRVEEVLALGAEKIVLSPGPGRPKAAGICEELIQNCPKDVPVLGVCLGHQAICEAFGSRIVRAEQLMHGKQSCIQITDDPLFEGISNPMKAARYHSLVCEKKNLSKELDVIAFTSEGSIMAVKHKHKPIYGLQFHPESILTPEGKRIIKNFMKLGDKKEGNII